MMSVSLSLSSLSISVFTDLVLVASGKVYNYFTTTLQITHEKMPPPLSSTSSAPNRPSNFLICLSVCS